MMKELLQEIQLPAYEFTENPVPMDRVDYDNLLSKLIQQTSRFAGLVAIYSLTKEIYPGLTKLRVCYVLSDTLDEDALRKGLIPTLKKMRMESAILDPVQYFPQAVFQHIDQISPMIYLKSEFGQEIRFSGLPGEDRNFAYLLSLNDRLIMSPLVQLIVMLVKGEIAVKPAWMGIESTIELISHYQKAIGKIPPDWLEFIKKTHELGRNWFSLNLGRYQEIKQLAREAVIILFTMIVDFEQHVQKEKLFFIQEFPPTTTDSTLPVQPIEYRASFFTNSIRALFIDKWTPELGFHKVVNLYKKTGGVCLYLPTLMSVPYALYLRGIDFHSTLVQKSLLMHGYSGNVAMPGLVDSRNRWLSQYLIFTQKYKDLMDYPVWLGYPLEIPSKWAKWLENRRKAQHEKWQHNQSLELARI